MRSPSGLATKPSFEGIPCFLGNDFIVLGIRDQHRHTGHPFSPACRVGRDAAKRNVIARRRTAQSLSAQAIEYGRYLTNRPVAIYKSSALFHINESIARKRLVPIVRATIFGIEIASLGWVRLMLKHNERLDI